MSLCESIPQFNKPQRQRTGGGSRMEGVLVRWTLESVRKKRGEVKEEG